MHMNIAVFSRTKEEAQAFLDKYSADLEAESPYTVFEEDEDEELDETTGKHGYWHNPDRIYDGYLIGGRWRGFLRLLPDRHGEYGERSWVNEGWADMPGRCDIARVRDCDFSIEPEEYDRALRFWDFAVEGKPQAEGEEPWAIYGTLEPQKYLDAYGTKETFAKCGAAFSTASFISADGEWHEQSHDELFPNEGYFCDRDIEYEQAFSNALEDAKARDLFITIADCHV